MNSFWHNLRGILVNSPLVLSDSYDPKDISANRIAFMLVLVNTLAMAWYAVLHPQIIPQVDPVLTKLMMFLGAQATIVNMIKHGLETMRQIKGVGNNATTGNTSEGGVTGPGPGTGKAM